MSSRRAGGYWRGGSGDGAADAGAAAAEDILGVWGSLRRGRTGRQRGRRGKREKKAAEAAVNMGGVFKAGQFSGAERSRTLPHVKCDNFFVFIFFFIFSFSNVLDL